nr:hypothetical protein [Tanacetum cinerariifolium]
MCLMFSLAAWNIRGLNCAPKQSEVRQVVNENQLSMCAILESHVDIATLSNICSKVFRSWDWTSNGRLCDTGCRIIIGWNMDVVDMVVVSQSSQAMHVQIQHKLTNSILHCLFIYAGNLPTVRRLLWADLNVHKHVVKNMPWILMGDFNVALNIADSHSGSSQMNSAIIEFNDCVSKIEVMDINSMGIHFTWNQKPNGGDGILKKLDRIMDNIEFIDSFPAPTQSSNLTEYRIILYRTEFWNRNVDGHIMFQVVSKIKSLNKPLRKLVHDHGNFHDRVSKLRAELDEVQKTLDLDMNNQILREEESVYVEAFNEAKLDEERFLKQKAKIEWLDVGDSNSAYFYIAVRSRNQRSRIEVVLNSDNIKVSGPSILDVFVSHYEMFLGSNMSCVDLNIDGLFHNKVSGMFYLDMVREVSDDEIKNTMFGIRDDRAPGPNGFTSAFFKKGWDVVGSDVYKAIWDFFTNGRRISDNIFITRELMHSYHRNRVPPSINGDIHGYFKGKRGLRKGDPLSPYLFTLVMEVLTLILKRKVRFLESFHYHKHCEELQLINVCLVDDLFIFARGDVDSARIIIEALDEFKGSSGFSSEYSQKFLLQRGMCGRRLDLVGLRLNGFVSCGFLIVFHVMLSTCGLLCEEASRPKTILGLGMSDLMSGCMPVTLLIQPRFQDIVAYLQPISKKRTTQSIIGRLIFVASSYFIWIERNNRLFKKIRRLSKEIRDLIMVTVHLKLTSFRFKNKDNVNRLLARWQMPRNFRLYKSGKKMRLVTHGLEGYEFENTCNNEKNLSEIQLELEKEDELVVVVVKVVHELDCIMVVKEIEDGLLEEMEKFGWWFEKDIGGEIEDDREKRL